MFYHSVRGLQCSVVPTQRLQWREEVTAASDNMSVSGNWNVITPSGGCGAHNMFSVTGNVSVPYFSIQYLLV